MAKRTDEKGYSETYLKTANNQLLAIFNYAVRYYDLKDNPCRKAGSIGKSHAGEKEFWTGMKIGELLVLTYNNIDLEKCTISVNKSYQRIEGRDIITPPKTPKSKRIITIPPFLTEELKEYISQLYGIMADERMFRFTKSYMGHEKIKTTLNTYSHLYPNKQGNLRINWRWRTAGRKRNERSA